MEIHETSDFKLKDWCQLKGIRAEIKNVSWLSKKELAKNSAVVLLFTFVMGLFFFGGDAVIAFILKALGMN
ncbi:preprotein translocase subunit SecE [Erysipelatoclostridium sp. AM42-17]|nr:preprotein translocase subunit SecE [Coprobacillus sp. AF33-1AC]RHS94002.1 preprotein translocase subunit SecE [Erysipelatoclostridium sp. AM42-17]